MYRKMDSIEQRSKELAQINSQLDVLEKVSLKGSIACWEVLVPMQEAKWPVSNSIK